MIQLKGVTKKFGALTAVDDVSYTIRRGEYFALLGPNGAGKTTIVRMILGFSAPTCGMVTLEGMPAANPAAHQGIGYLAENHRIPPFLSGRAYLRRHAALVGLSGKSAQIEVDRILELINMAGNADKKSATYSKGMVQRIGFGAALLGKPKLLILDEPVAGLDPIGIRKTRSILENLRQESLTLILNSHLLSEVEKTCDSVAIMDQGRILVKDAIYNIVKENESLEDVFIRYTERNGREITGKGT